MRHKPAVCLLKNALQHEKQSESIQQDSPVLFAAKLAEVPLLASFLIWRPMMLSQFSILQIPLLSNQKQAPVYNC